MPRLLDRARRLLQAPQFSDRLTPEDLARYDYAHNRGIEASMWTTTAGGDPEPTNPYPANDSNEWTEHAAWNAGRVRADLSRAEPRFDGQRPDGRPTGGTSRRYRAEYERLDRARLTPRHRFVTEPLPTADAEGRWTNRFDAIRARADWDVAFWAGRAAQADATPFQIDRDDPALENAAADAGWRYQHGLQDAARAHAQSAAAQHPEPVALPAVAQALRPDGTAIGVVSAADLREYEQAADRAWAAITSAPDLSRVRPDAGSVPDGPAERDGRPERSPLAPPQLAERLAFPTLVKEWWAPTSARHATAIVRFDRAAERGLYDRDQWRRQPDYPARNPFSSDPDPWAEHNGWQAGADAVAMRESAFEARAVSWRDYLGLDPLRVRRPDGSILERDSPPPQAPALDGPQLQPPTKAPVPPRSVGERVDARLQRVEQHRPPDPPSNGPDR